MVVEEYIKEKWGILSREEIANKLNISISSLYVIARRIGIEINKSQSDRAKSPFWTDEEIKYLQENYHKLKIKELSDKLCRTICAIHIKARSINLKPKSNKWTEEEINLLIKKYSICNTEEIKNLFNTHSIGSINKKAKSLGLKRKNIERPKWSKKEKEKVIELAKNGYSDIKIAEKLNRGIDNIKEIRRKKILRRHIWSDKEIELLKSNYHKPLNELKKILNLSEESITRKGRKLGLKRPIGVWSKKEVNILKNNYK